MGNSVIRIHWIVLYRLDCTWSILPMNYSVLVRYGFKLLSSMFWRISFGVLPQCCLFEKLIAVRFPLTSWLPLTICASYFKPLKPSQLTVIANLGTIDFLDRNALHPSPYRFFQWLFQLNSGLQRQMEKWIDKLAVSLWKGGKLPIIL